MNGKKLAIVAGLAAIAVGSYVLLRGGRGKQEELSGTGAGTGTGTDQRVERVRRPIRMSGGVAPDLEGVPAQLPQPPEVIDAMPQPSLAEGFEAERREPSWATAHEREIDRRLGALPAEGIALDRTECRERQCRITITAENDAALGRFVGHIESDADGLYGYAHMIVLEAVSTTPDGKRRERIYAQFE